MPITLQLEPELEARLTRKAEQSGLPVDVWLRNLVDQATADPPLRPDEKRLPPEVVAERIRWTEERLAELRKQPILDNRSEDEILGWDEHGLPYK